MKTTKEIVMSYCIDCKNNITIPPIPKDEKWYSEEEFKQGKLSTLNEIEKLAYNQVGREHLNSDLISFEKLHQQISKLKSEVLK